MQTFFLIFFSAITPLIVKFCKMFFPSGLGIYFSLSEMEITSSPLNSWHQTYVIRRAMLFLTVSHIADLVLWASVTVINTDYMLKSYNFSIVLIPPEFFWKTYSYPERRGEKWQSQQQDFPQPQTPSCHSEGSLLVPQMFCAFIWNRRLTDLHKSGTVAPFIFSQCGYHINLRRTAGELFFQRFIHSKVGAGGVQSRQKSAQKTWLCFTV